jgi:hypothetical protein
MMSVMGGRDAVGSVDAIRGATAELASEQLSNLSPGALCDRVVELVDAWERLEAELLRTLGAWDAAGAYASDDRPALSPHAWLTDRTPLSRTVAGRLMRSARLAFAHDRTGVALAEGDVRVGHVDELARVVTDERSCLYPEHESTLLRSAGHLKVDWFRRAARTWGHCADDALQTDDAFELRERRRLHLSSTMDGSGVLDGRLDPEGTGWVADALDVAGRREALERDDARTAAQRRADALVEICRTYLRGKATGSGAELLVHVDAATYAGIASSDPASALCELDGVGPVAPETIRRLACDGVLRRVLVDADGEILDLGRRVRIASPAQRRAVIARDRHCVFPGCTRPARFCQVHHVDEWRRGGSTNLDRLCLLCRRHHVVVHEGGWTLKRSAGAWHAAQRDRRGHDPPVVRAA